MKTNGEHMEFISVAAAITITGWSERTFWRKFADGSIPRKPGKGRTLIPFEVVKSNLCIPLGTEDLALLHLADEGDANAQTELALIFFERSVPKGAIFWLELAAKRGSPDAMYLLGRSYIDGHGVEVNEDLGIMWIAKAAAENHLISKSLMQSLRTGFRDLRK